MATVIFGAPLWSDFRIQGLIERLKHLVPVRSMTVRAFSLCDGAAHLTDAQKKRLSDLLEEQSEPALGTVRFWILPRLGTVSPWASKAMDILKNWVSKLLLLSKGVASIWFYRKCPQNRA